MRFRTEFHPNIYNDIFTLYALNEGQTYRYSVSSAGAGGMVQMIPSTYRMVRSRFPNAALMPDFVEGMRNHVNATQAMLLYMQMTWNDLIASPTVFNAHANRHRNPGTTHGRRIQLKPAQDLPATSTAAAKTGHRSSRVKLRSICKYGIPSNAPSP